jgi:hypothetical protein
MKAGIGEDKLSGAEAIAEFIGEPLRRTFHLLETRQIPAGKIGGKWVASKTAVREHYERIMRGEITVSPQARTAGP